MRTIHIGRILSGAVLTALLGHMPAQAQGGAVPSAGGGRVFIDAAAIADYDQTDFEPPGPAPAGGVGIGARLWRRYSVRIEFDVPGKHVELNQAPGLEHRFASTTTSYAFLLGRQFRMETRAPIVVLLGVSALTHRTHVTGFFDYAPRGATESRHAEFDDHMVEQWVALTIGVETPLTLTRHLRLVPQVRAHEVANAELGQLFPSGKSALRPRLSLRWQF